MDVVYDVTGALDDAYDCLVDGGKLCTAVPQSESKRDFKEKNITFVKVLGYYAGPDVYYFPEGKPVNGYHATPEHTVFGRLVKKNLPALLEKKIIVVSSVSASGYR